MVDRLSLSFPRAAAHHLFSWYSNETHYTAVPAEDHTPFSQTGWPLPCPQWVVFATDVMHRTDLDVDCHTLFAYWLSEARAGRMPWLKYLIWQATCYDVRNHWEPQPNKDHFDHIHISARTDYKNANLGAWSIRPTGDDMSLKDSLKPYNGVDISLGTAIAQIWARTDYLANKTGLVARLDKILAAASNDGQTTVSMSPEDRAALAHQLAEALHAHDAAEPADAVEA